MMLRAVREERARRAADAEHARLQAAAEAIRARCVTLAGFVREAWHVLEPTTEYVHSWHIDAICEHLEAVSRGEINRLLINVPPGTMKSLLVSVLLQAWEWGPCGLASLRYLATSFAEENVKRDTRKARDLIMSDWYRTLWPHVRLVRTGELSFANSVTGTRESSAFGSLTSKRGDRLIIDDPHSTLTAESDQERATTTRQFREGATNRLNDMKRSAIIVVMQRLHEEDVSGVIRKLGMEYVHLRLPMEFEASEACSTPIGFRDPRSFEGDLLDPVRFPRDVVVGLQRDMGPYAFAGQYQQRPGPRDGAFFHKAWFKRYVTAPSRHLLRVYMSSDHAPTAGKHSDYSCIRVWGMDPNRDVYMLDGRRMHATMDEVSDFAIEMIRKWEPFAWFPEDDNNWKAAAPFIVERMRAKHARTRIEPISPHGADKASKAQSFQGLAATGRIWLPDGPEGDDVLQQYITFPAAAHDDEVDAGSIMGRAIAMAHPAIVEPVAHAPRGPKPLNETTYDELMAMQEPVRERI